MFFHGFITSIEESLMKFIFDPIIFWLERFCIAKNLKRKVELKTKLNKIENVMINKSRYLCRFMQKTLRTFWPTNYQECN